MSLTFDYVWDESDAEAKIQAAIDMVERLDPPADLRAPAFGLAVQLLTQRIARQAGGLVLGGLGPVQ